jgi:hypothetical protein
LPGDVRGGGRRRGGARWVTGEEASAQYEMTMEAGGAMGDVGRRALPPEQLPTLEIRYFATSCGCTPSLHAILSLKDMKLLIDVGYTVCCALRKFHLKI